MKKLYATIATFLLIGFLSGCGGGGGETPTPAASTGGSPPSEPTGPIAPPKPSAPSPLTDLEATKALLKAAMSAGGVPATMASPPIVTPGIANMPSSIKDSRLLPPDSPALRYVGAVKKAGPDYPDDQLVKNTAVNYGAFGPDSNVYYIEFVTDAPTFEIMVKGNVEASAHRLLVDGAYTSTSAVAYPDDGNLYLTRVDFQGGRKSRNIRIETPNMRFGGLRIAPGDSVSAPPTEPRPRAVILGDSITEGMAGQGFSFDNYATRLGYLMGWKDMYQSGVGATGYLEAPDGKLKLRDRLSTDVLPFSPHVLVIAAGTNDTGHPKAELQAEATALFDAVEKNLPFTVVFVLGPWSPGSAFIDQRDAIKAAVGSRANFHFIDNVGERWQTGTGNAGDLKGDGNGDVYVSEDGTHPTPAGHVYLAGKVADAVAKVVKGF